MIALKYVFNVKYVFYVLNVKILWVKCTTHSYFISSIWRTERVGLTRQNQITSLQLDFSKGEHWGDEPQLV